MKNKLRRTLKKSMRGNFRKKSRRKTRKIPRKRTRRKRYIGGAPTAPAAPAAAAAAAAAAAPAAPAAEEGGWGWPPLDVLAGLGASALSRVNPLNYFPAYPTGGAAGEQQAQRQRDRDAVSSLADKLAFASAAAPKTAVQAEAIRLLGLNGDQLHSEGGTAPITYLMRGNLMRLVNGGAITGENWVPPAGSPQYIIDLVLNIAPGGALSTLSEILPHLVRHEVGLCTCNQYTGSPGIDYLREIAMDHHKRIRVAKYQDPRSQTVTDLIDQPAREAREARDLGRWAAAQRRALALGEDQDGPWYSDRARGSAENVAGNFRKWSMRGGGGAREAYAIEISAATHTLSGSVCQNYL